MTPSKLKDCEIRALRAEMALLAVKAKLVKSNRALGVYKRQERYLCGDDVTFKECIGGLWKQLRAARGRARVAESELDALRGGGD